MICIEPSVWHGATEEFLRYTYCAFNIGVNTAQGEGWGLTTMEGMACGIPHVVPDCAALGEWPGDAVVKVPCREIAVTPNKINVIGAIPDRGAFIAALDALYREAKLRAELTKKGLALVRNDAFRWPTIGAQYAVALDAVHRGAFSHG